MIIREFNDILAANPAATIRLMLPDGDLVPAHFHITEVGRVRKDFVDCGGTIRSVSTCALQVWVAEDVAHRLTARKLAQIMQKAAPVLGTDDLPVEIECQNGTVSLFPVSCAEATPSGISLYLGNKHTACLAPDRCGLPMIQGETNCC